jgi:hypothetical protein
VSVECH